MKISLLASAVILALLASAVPVPITDLGEIVQRADLITVGKIVAVQELGDTTIELYGQKVGSRRMFGEMRVDEILKGSASTPAVVKFEFDLPVTPDHRGFGSVSVDTYRVVFLKTGSTLRFVNPYRPSVIAIPGTPIVNGNPLDKVADQLAGVLLASRASSEEKAEAIFALSSLRSPRSTSALKQALHENNKIILAQAIAALLQRNETSVLPKAEEILADPNPGIPQYLVHNISYAVLNGVKDAKAVPSLARLLKSNDVITRRAAAFALRNTASWSAVPALSKALTDSDTQVRYYGVIGLAEITQQNEWRPLDEEFRKNQAKYLSHWREWSENNPQSEKP